MATTSHNFREWWCSNTMSFCFWLFSGDPLHYRVCCLWGPQLALLCPSMKQDWGWKRRRGGGGPEEEEGEDLVQLCMPVDSTGSKTYLLLLLYLQNPWKTHAAPPPPPASFLIPSLTMWTLICLLDGEYQPHTCTKGQRPCGWKRMWSINLVFC